MTARPGPDAEDGFAAGREGCGRCRVCGLSPAPGTAAGGGRVADVLRRCPLVHVAVAAGVIAGVSVAAAPAAAGTAGRVIVALTVAAVLAFLLGVAYAWWWFLAGAGGEQPPGKAER